MLNLFDTSPITEKNLLPYDGEVFYYGCVWNMQDADTYFQTLLNRIAWEHDELWMMGKRIITKRKVAWYGTEPFSYTYSKTTKLALPFTRELMQLKELTEKQTGETYNSCLLNLYHNGDEGMTWHSDAERELKKEGAIASLSFGATRKFMFKHKQTNETISTILEHGSLLVMKGTTQTHWLHKLPTTTRVSTPRINLTFRTIVSPASH
jgi:alkylated DNA repair dioxygenase AlkB